MNEPNARTTPRPAGRRRPTASPTASTYRRRRAVVGGVLATFVAVGTLAAHDVLAGSGGVPASAAEGLPALVDGPSTLTAQPGDTLWAIAERYRGDVSLTRYVDKLVDLNGGPSLQAGQQVLLP